MRPQIYTQNPPPPPLETAAYDLLATVDHWLRHVIPYGAPDAGHIAMLTASADWLRRELLAKALSSQ